MQNDQYTMSQSNFSYGSFWQTRQSFRVLPIHLLPRPKLNNESSTFEYMIGHPLSPTPPLRRYSKVKGQETSYIIGGIQLSSELYITIQGQTKVPVTKHSPSELYITIQGQTKVPVTKHPRNSSYSNQGQKLRNQWSQSVMLWLNRHNKSSLVSGFTHHPCLLYINRILSLW